MCIWLLLPGNLKFDKQVSAPEEGGGGHRVGQ